MSDIPEKLRAALAGDYDLIRELGEGGMAVVYLATDLKHNREVAIKVLKEDLAAVVGEARFLDEIQTTAKLQHPNILPLFDSGARDGFLFYAMPYVEGETLREKLKREVQLPVEDAIEIVHKIASALDYAHEKGIVHRDIKPANILLSSGEPLVADFGIALAVSQANDGRRTETGLSLGTPHYMSPEQAAGDRSLDPSYQLTFMGENNGRPRWMPDGRVAYLSDQEEGRAKIFAQPYDRSGEPELLVGFPDSLLILDFEIGPDQGAPILVTALTTGSNGQSGIFLADPRDPGGAPVPFVDTPFSESQAAISPDGEWVAYTSDENDREEVYVRKFPEGGRPWAVASELSNRPSWSPNSDEVMYLTPDGVVARPLDIGDEVRVTDREVVFSYAGLYEMAGGPGRTYDVASDGRLLVTAEAAAQRTTAVEGQEAPEIIVTFNVFRDIEERLAQLEGGR